MRSEKERSVEQIRWTNSLKACLDSISFVDWEQSIITLRCLFQTKLCLLYFQSSLLRRIYSHFGADRCAPHGLMTYFLLCERKPVASTVTCAFFSIVLSGHNIYPWSLFTSLTIPLAVYFPLLYSTLCFVRGEILFTYPTTSSIISNEPLPPWEYCSLSNRLSYRLSRANAPNALLPISGNIAGCVFGRFHTSSIDWQFSFAKHSGNSARNWTCYPFLTCRFLPVVSSCFVTLHPQSIFFQISLVSFRRSAF